MDYYLNMSTHRLHQTRIAEVVARNRCLENLFYDFFQNCIIILFSKISFSDLLLVANFSTVLTEISQLLHQPSFVSLRTLFAVYLALPLYAITLDVRACSTQISSQSIQANTNDVFLLGVHRRGTE